MKNVFITTLTVLAIAVGVAPMGHAITTDQVVELAQAGSGDGLIMSKIDADASVFQLTVEEILSLQDAGVSNAVITYMINTGKQTDQPSGSSEERDADEASAEDWDDETYGDDYDDYDDYSTSVAAGYSNTGFGVSVGYYYPSWPGYYYSAYYDPFDWAGWGYYYSYCSPYPYWRWYNRSYASYTYSYSYWNRCSTPYPYYGHHQGHGYVHKKYADKYSNHDSDGRYAGSRGTVHRGRTRTDSRNGSDAVMANNRLITPRRPNTSVVREDSNNTDRGYTLRKPRTNVERETVETPKRVTRRGPNVTPSRGKVHPETPSSGKVKRPSKTSRSVKRPAPTRKPAKVTPKKESSDKPAAKKPGNKRVTPKPSPSSSKAKAAPAQRSSSSRQATGRKTGGRRGGGGGN